MRAVILISLGILTAAAPPQPPAGPGGGLVTARDSALHALNRLAYGPRPGQIDSVARTGVMRWIDAQLDASGPRNERLAEREASTPLLHLSTSDLAQRFFAAQQERRARARQGQVALADNQMMAGPDELRARALGGQLQQLAVERAVLSDQQLQEVMVDFWSNHFNVFFGKGADRFLLPDYVEHTIRPRALGKFSDLLIATAQSPAMLFYLDNWQNVRSGGWAGGEADRRIGGQGNRRAHGINENYARELLELHTLGVDGGYTQQDVIAVARIMTGWSITPPKQGGAFMFRPRAHDDGEKLVMGEHYPSGHGMDEGMRLLHWLANEPATMHHVSWQLCQRFVNDVPPDGCVDDAVAAWRRTDGDIREVLRAIFHGPDFWANANVGVKVKTPLEFVASAVRAVGAEPDSTPRLAQVVARLGEPLYLHTAPDGYPDREADWVNSGALLQRMNVAVAIAAGRLPGVDWADRRIGGSADRESSIGVELSAHTKQVIENEARDDEVFALGLALGSPDFQRR